jgi:hypothetical protein
MKAYRFIAVLGALVLSGCIYDAPITEKPTGKIDERLLGDWVEKDDSTRHLLVCKLNEKEYVIHYAGMFRAFFSDVDGKRFVNLQNIEPAEDAKRKYAFAAYELKNAGTLVVRTVNTEVILENLHSSAEIAASIGRNLKNPKLFNEDAGVFVREDKH